MIRNILTRTLIYAYIYYQSVSDRVKAAYSQARLNEFNAFSSHIRYPFINTKSMSEPESYFQVPMSQFTVLTQEANQHKLEFLDNIMNTDDKPVTYEAWPNGMFKAKRRLVTRTSDSYYWN